MGMTHTATAPVQPALFGRYGEVQTDIFEQIANAQAETCYHPRSCLRCQHLGYTCGAHRCCTTRPNFAEGDTVTVHATNGRRLGLGRVLRITPSGLIVSYLYRGRIRTVCINPVLVRAA